MTVDQSASGPVLDEFRLFDTPPEVRRVTFAESGCP